MPPLARKTSAEFFRKSHITHQSSPADLEALKQHALNRIDDHHKSIDMAKNSLDMPLINDSSSARQKLTEVTDRQIADAEHRAKEWAITYDLVRQAQAIQEIKDSQTINFHA